MKKRLIYLPLEPYVERYTYLMSCPGGWAEQHFAEHGVEFIRVDGDPQSGQIHVGSVLDAYGRSLYSMSQTASVVRMLRQGEIREGDVIFTEDFWHVGIDSLFYIREMTGVRFEVACFIHAQSIDNSDFTYAMRHWLRDIEVGMSKGYDYVFTCSPILKYWAELAGMENLYVTGLPLNSRALLKQVEAMGVPLNLPKRKQVLFSSRFDTEKNPSFFLDLVAAAPHIDFVLCKPRKHLSNDPAICARAEDMDRLCSNFRIEDTSTKERYYQLLAESAVQFNCAEQDWVSWTLVEATLFGCHPVYPMHKDFPTELHGDMRYLYGHLNKAEALRCIQAALANPQPPDTYKKHDLSWPVQLDIMGLR